MIKVSLLPGSLDVCPLSFPTTLRKADMEVANTGPCIDIIGTVFAPGILATASFNIPKGIIDGCTTYRDILGGWDLAVAAGPIKTAAKVSVGFSPDNLTWLSRSSPTFKLKPKQFADVAPSLTPSKNACEHLRTSGHSFPANWGSIRHFINPTSMILQETTTNHQARQPPALSGIGRYAPGSGMLC